MTSGGRKLVSKSERECHGALDNDEAIDAGDAVELPHAAPQAPNGGLDFYDIAGMNGPPVANAFDPHEVDQLLAVLGLREDHDGAHLRHGLGQDRRRQHRRVVVAVCEVPLVQGHVLDANDALVGFELGDAIDEQERVAVREDSFDRRVIQGESQIHGGQPV